MPVAPAKLSIETDLLMRAKRCFPAAYNPRLIVAKGEGAVVQDVHGKRYLEFLTVNTFGHHNPEIAKALQAQINCTIDSLGISKSAIQLAESLKKALPGKLGGGKVLFSRSGTEVCDYAASLARSYTKRPVMLSFYDSYHGLTGGTISLTNTTRFRSKLSGSSLIKESVYAPFPNRYHCHFCKNSDRCGLECLEDLNEIFDKLVSSEDVAACIIEPIQMDGGVNIAPTNPNYLRKLQRLCNSHGILLIVDEVYTAFGKTGRIFAIENWDVEPDILVIGKCMGGGLPLAGIVARKEILDNWSLGGIAMRPNVAATATAFAHFSLLTNDLLQNAVRVGNHITKVLKEFKDRFERIGDVRGIGLLIGAELVKNKSGSIPATDTARRIRREALKRGLIINTTGSHEHVLTISPPLTITMEQADEGLRILEKALEVSS
jgi:4-aminobutyrate aminotransferase-like enzyme